MTIKWPVPEKFKVRKKTANRIGFSMNQNFHTVDAELKDWLHENVKKHWFLSEEHDSSTFLWNRTLYINFSNPQEAMLYKLVWG